MNGFSAGSDARSPRLRGCAVDPSVVPPDFGNHRAVSDHPTLAHSGSCQQQAVRAQIHIDTE